MQTRRDQVQAHMFVMSRLTTGMQRNDPDLPDPPTGRTSRGVLIGLALAVAIGVVAGLYGAIVPGGATSWRRDGTLVIDEDTGARLLYLRGELHPVLNQASAKLLAGDQMQVETVHSSSLRGTPRGAPVGIVGAPEALPAPGVLTTGPWSACVPRAGGGTGRRPPAVALTVGVAPAGRALGPAEATLVTGSDDATYLLWRGQRLRLDTKHGALAALGYDAVSPLPVTGTLLNILPAGPDLAAPEVPGRGEPGPTIAGNAKTRYGQLFTGPGGAEHYLLRKDGLVALTETLFDLVRGDPRTQREAYAGSVVTPLPLGPNDLVQYAAPADAKARLTAGGLPDSPPAAVPVGAQQGTCVRLQPRPDVAPTISVDVVDAGTLGGRAPAIEPGVTPACRQADLVQVRPQAGALVRALSAGGGMQGVTYLITDTGVKYPVPGSEIAQLGYRGAPTVRLPGTLLGVLPTGPSLDRWSMNGATIQAPAANGKCIP